MSDPRTTSERYLAATASSNLRVKETACDADQLLAAAYAAQGDARKGLALQVWRVRVTGSLSGTHALVRGLGGLVRDHDRHQKRTRRHQVMAWTQAQMLAAQTLRWWKSSVCHHCNGLGHPTLPNAPVLDMTRECPYCHGTGQRPLERQVRTEHIDHARWLVSQMESLSAVIFDDMRRLLRQPN